MSKTEDIEAKLAAYIDGELDAAGRAEIEKHLVANPKHRALIQELMGHKDLLKVLPRQIAPADLAEAFTAQLERAVLLGDVDSEPIHPPMRIGFFQQFRAVAAVLVLTVGVAAIIYRMLPRTQGSDSPLASLRMAPLSPGVVLETDTRIDSEVPALTTAPRADSATSGPSIASAAVVMPTPPAPSTPVESIPAIGEHVLESMAAAAPATGPSQSPRETVAVAVNDAFARDVATFPLRRDESIPGTFNNGGTAADAVFRELVGGQRLRPTTTPSSTETIVFKAQDMDIANLEITRYLDTNSIRWNAETEAMPGSLALNESQIGMASRLQQSSVELKNPPPLPTGGRGGGGRGRSGLDAAVSNQRMTPLGGSNMIVSAPATLPAPVATGNTNRQRIVARQISRQQAQQVATDLNQLQDSIASGKQQAPQQISLDARNNDVGVLGGLNYLQQQEDASLRPNVQLDLTQAPPGPLDRQSLGSSFRLLPVDLFDMLALHREPFSFTLPTTQPNAGLAFELRNDIAPVAPSQDLVDVIIVLEPQPAAAPQAGQQPAP